MFNQNSLFQSVEKKTGVSMDAIFQLVNSVQNANLKDEQTVRYLIQQVAKLANKSVSQDLEDQIVNTIVNNSQDVNFQTISNMLTNRNNSNNNSSK